jgi:uncharacterized protein (DUF433 family)
MAQRAARIVRSGDVLHGEPRIEGRRVSVRQLRSLVEERGLDAAEVADRLDLRVADVYAALTYSHEHPEEMAEIEAERDRRVAESAADAPSLEDLQSGGES